MLGLLDHPCGSDVIEEGLGCRKVGPQISGVLGMGKCDDVVLRSCLMHGNMPFEVWGEVVTGRRRAVCGHLLPGRADPSERDTHISLRNCPLFLLCKQWSQGTLCGVT